MINHIPHKESTLMFRYTGINMYIILHIYLCSLLNINVLYTFYMTFVRIIYIIYKSYISM